MEAFANHNKWLLQSDYTALRAVSVNVQPIFPSTLRNLVQLLHGARIKGSKISRAYQEKVAEQTGKLKPGNQSPKWKPSRRWCQSLGKVQTKLGSWKRARFWSCRTTAVDEKWFKQVSKASMWICYVSPLDESRQVLGTEVSERRLLRLWKWGTKEWVLPDSRYRIVPSPQPDLPQVDQGVSSSSKDQ